MVCTVVMNKYSVAIAVGVVLMLASQVSAKEDCFKKIDAAKNKCKSELKLSDDDVKGLDKDEPFSNGTKCLIKCIAESFEIFSNGSLVESKVMSMIDEFTANKPEIRERDLTIYKECKDLSGECPCDTASKIYSCIRETLKKLMMNMPNKKM